METPFIVGKRCYLRPLKQKDINSRYLSWLNDPKINFYSNRRFFPYSYQELTMYYRQRKKDSLLLAIVEKKADKHIGNILLGPIKWQHRNAELSILIGDKDFWNRGMATEAIYLLSKHAFRILNLHRIESGSINPAFIKVVCKKLGWKKEGELREKFWRSRSFVDITVTSLLKNEFKPIREFENRAD